MIFFHPPYHDIIKYSGNMWGQAHPDDLSRCENYNDFIEKLNFIIKKLYLALRKDGRLAILVGDSSLPEDVVITSDDVDCTEAKSKSDFADIAGKFLSDKYGFCFFGFSMIVVKGGGNIPF